jgi:hypothetical protein
MPAGDVWSRNRSLAQSIESQYASFVRSGRAVFGVVLRGFRERDRPVGWTAPDRGSIEYVDDMAHHLIDLRRGMDYLESREELDTARIALGHGSAGGTIMALPAIEKRYAAVIFWGAGIDRSLLQRRDEVNPIHFAPLIRQPKLLIHGIYDETTPLRTAAEPLFQLLPEPKLVRTYEGGHLPDPEFLLPEINSWLDATLGPATSRLALD